MPIMAERSTDAQFLKPAVLSLAFGVAFALFVTLFMVPALYCIGEDIKHGTRKIRGMTKSAFFTLLAALGFPAKSS
jgi:hypothetical protein